MIVVTGHQAEQVEQALAGLKVKFVHNPDFAEGLASSVKAGIAAVPRRCRRRGGLSRRHAADRSADLIDRLIEAFAPDRGNLIAVPVSDGRRGNPVLWSRRFFNELMTLDGDIGARHLIAKHSRGGGRSPGRGPRRLSRHRHPAGAGRGAAGIVAVGWAKRSVPTVPTRGQTVGTAQAALPILQALPFTKLKRPPS